MAQRLKPRINQNVLTNIRMGKIDNLNRCVNITSSAMSEHMIKPTNIPDHFVSTE